MMIIIITRYIYIITPSYMFRLLLSEPSSGWTLFFKKAMHTTDNTIIDCEISNYIFKIL